MHLQMSCNNKNANGYNKPLFSNKVSPQQMYSYFKVNCLNRLRLNTNVAILSIIMVWHILKWISTITANLKIRFFLICDQLLGYWDFNFKSDDHLVQSMPTVARLALNEDKTFNSTQINERCTYIFLLVIAQYGF